MTNIDAKKEKEARDRDAALVKAGTMTQADFDNIYPTSTKTTT